MRVDIWSEITCPWCGLSSHRLDRAVERLEHRDQVDVVHHPFPLSSSFSKDRTLGIREAMMAKYGVIPEQAGAPDIESMAAAEGLALYGSWTLAWNEIRPIIAVELGGDARTCGPEGCEVPVRP
ncbi:DSBA-like thioredoxin domain [Mycobacteroides abscessus]|uniref:DsbA family protein n=1 Tax=Mycobacteroides abscessus TaxID=36809 RepID=UPI0005DF588E|nr:DsbA family protein [Mycobacteroides abscessus]CPU58109.1 DSBA-like thioredoxin domain [Mycobacteroides abscessus]CPX34646.1 DSBA-like thioredoxin domain [Mycobacteroides abscessus]CPZ49033.1 DSBA-like thioredoxin domain [Mycobacteroides abscessus]